MAAVIRLLRGEDLDRLSRELRVTAATLSSRREEFMAGVTCPPGAPPVLSARISGRTA